MADVTITLDGERADIVRRAVAEHAEGTAKAIGSHAGSLQDGFFRRDQAEWSRGALEYCVRQLQAQLAVLAQVPWSTEEEAELGLMPKGKAREIKAIVAGKAEAS